MTFRNTLVLLIMMAFGFPSFAQQTAVYTEAQKAYKRGTSFFDQGLFAKAQREFQDAIQLLQPVNEAESELLRTKAHLGNAQCAVRLDLPEGEKLMLDFIRDNSPDPLAGQALADLANYYFDSREYEKAIDYYGKVPTGGMTREQKGEIRFKLGYSLFVQKRFSPAKANFQEIKNLQTQYYYPTHYYLGLCYFFEGNYSEAIQSLRIAEDSKSYKSLIPYYITQIYFAERQFETLIAYAEPKLQDNQIREKKEISQLVGQSYFELNNFEKALPFLEYYAEGTSKLREEEWYQLGFAQYQNRQYQKAVTSFEQLSTANSLIGQNAMFYLADCYLKLGRKGSARTALATAKRMNFDPVITEDALFNYAKLSYELNDPREALLSLQSIEPTSRYFTQAQNLMGEIFLSYRDYKQAIEIIEGMPGKTPQIQETYQKVTCYRGMQLLQEGDLANAKRHFQKSLENPVDPKTRAIAIYWLGDLAHQEKIYEESIRQMAQFMTLARTMTGLPDESSLFTASYIQGYNYLKQNNHTTALQYFRDAVDGIQRNRRFIRNDYVKNQMLGDATLRVGDSYFKRNQYTEAVRYYDEAIQNRYAGYDYAIYQKAIIEGLRGRTTDKIIALERIPSELPNSEYADDALFQLGVTYQEIGKLNQAVPPLRQLVQNYRNRSNLVNKALLQLGLIHYNQNSLDMAITYYKQVFSNNPDNNEASLALAALEEIYVYDLGRPGDYFAFLETIPGYKLDNFARDSINFRAAESRFENGNYVAATEAYTNYINTFPNGRFIVTAHYHRGESYSVLKQFSPALRDYEWVVDRGPSNFYVKALEKAAIIAYNHEQDFRKSYELYTKLQAAALNPDMLFDAQLGALQSAYRIGDAQAVYDLAGKVANSPNATSLQVATANFYLGKFAFDRNDYPNALRSLNEVVRLSDNEQTAEARYLIAMIYYQQRDLEKAQEWCLTANRASSAYPYWVAKSVLLLSDILAEKGDLYNARAALEALLENYSEDQTVVSEARTKLQRINDQINRSSRLNTNPDTSTMEFRNNNNQ